MKITLKVVTNSKVKSFVKVDDKPYQYHIKLNSIAEDGKANKELIDSLAKYFHVSKNSIRIVSGIKNRFKTIEINE